MSETNFSGGTCRRLLSELRHGIFGCFYRKKVAEPLANQDAGLAQLQQHCNMVSNRLDQLAGTSDSDFNLVAAGNEIRYLTERVGNLETALAEQKNLFEKLINDFTRLEETHWCNISSIHSEDSPKLVLPTQSLGIQTNATSSPTHSHTELETGSITSDLSDDYNVSDIDSIGSSDIDN